MVLNSYAASLPFLTIPPREKYSDSHNVLLERVVLPPEGIIKEGFHAPLCKVVSIEVDKNPLVDANGVFVRQVTLKSGRVWHGYDEYAAFEAAIKVWLNPVVTGNVLLGNVYQHKHRTLRPYTTGSIWGSSMQTYPSTQPMRNDYYHLEELSDLAPIIAPVGSMIEVDRDFFNIEALGSPNYDAWDMELVLVVDE